MANHDTIFHLSDLDQSDLDTILAEAMTSTSFAACADAVRSSFHVRTIR
jgi:hypothetical protein